jgi:hypothetical protein
MEKKESQCQGTRMCFSAHQKAFALKCVNVLVEEYPPSNRKHPLQHQGAGHSHFLHPLQPANGHGLLGHLGRSQDRYDETVVLACPA